ncbi:restriction endonuclease subunit S [Alcanivorax sp. NBRC 102024]|uniref:restriction endonuclease subunit S n=1 Tax=Alcanivorax sp. NBRC 102024 TaxID=1113895 RepID=UPI000789FB47|nr:restriction endonuclease subunit S [Alcanivorax sp. NBRC 102024]
MKQKLGDLAEISLGFAVQGSVKPDPDGNVRIVRPANGNERLSIDWESVVRTSLPSKRKLRYLQDGDVLFQAIGKEHPAYLVEGVPEGPPAIAHQHFILIRAHSDWLDTGFLALVLNSDSAQAFFREKASGASGKVVNQGVLKEFEVPHLSLPEQLQWVQRWRQRCAAIETLRAEIDMIESWFRGDFEIEFGGR